MKYVKGATHGPEYSWHKYWSRKPANVISAYLEDLVPEGGLVVDPFSGSGVVLREATKLGFQAEAFDVNPVAVAISSFMITNLNVESFKVHAARILDQVEKELGYLYWYDNKEVRFLEHVVVTSCPSCETENVFSKEIHGASGKKCVRCGGKLSFGLSSMVSTKISEIAFVDGSVSKDIEDLHTQEMISQNSQLTNFSFNMPLVDNRRTLTSSNTSTGDFFTPRNFWILSRFAELAHEVKQPDLRNALLLMVTGSSAQASRLIASRGKLAGGGQAWTIPGFWVPPIHLESNPFRHLRSRAKKIQSALKALKTNEKNYELGKITQITAQQGLKNISSSCRSADLIFLDPPYGDSVAFLEFSAIWNAFLRESFSYHDDISVSDRLQEPMTKSRYREMLEEVAINVSAALSPEGRVLLTFNNNDLDAWKSIVRSLQRAGLRVSKVNYQDPAVVSTKSQMAMEGSYVGDFYVVFERLPIQLLSFNSVREKMKNLLINSASIRGGAITKGLAYRFCLQKWLSMNIDAEEIEQLDQLINELFVQDGKKLRLREANVTSESIEEMLKKISYGISFDAQNYHEQLSQALADHFEDFGIPSMVEALAILQSDTTPNQLW